MRGKPLETIFVTALYAILCGLRLIFLSSRTGALAHNFLYYWLFRGFASESEHRKLTGMLKRSLRERSAIIEWQARCYSSCTNVVRHTLKNIFARRLIVGNMRRRKLQRQGYVVPSVVMISLNTPGSGCNLACENCYAASRVNAVLPLAVAKKIVEDQEGLGIYVVSLLGGEPFLYEGIWEIFEDYPNTTFYVSTNGTQLSREIANRLANLGNVFPMISLEGFELHTDAIRGKGVFRQVTAAMQLCKELRLPYGVTVTVTRQNRLEVTSHAFLEFLDSLRCCGVTYSCYIAIGRSSHYEWQISPDESKDLDQVCDFVHDNFAMCSAVGRNGIARVNDCSAAREYIHILPDGRVEPCPFAQWATLNLNVRDHSLLDVMSSPFFVGVREFNRYGIIGAAPCEISRLASLQNAFKKMGATPTTLNFS